MKSLVLILLTLPTMALAYSGPRHPDIPADNQPIRASFDQCLQDVKDVVAWGDDVEREEARKLCQLRATHLAERQKLMGGLSKLVDTFDGMTNHDHDQNLPLTIQSIQNVVGSCLQALESQQYPHNIQLVVAPEENAIYCLRLGTQALQRIVSF